MNSPVYEPPENFTLIEISKEFVVNSMPCCWGWVQYCLVGIVIGGTGAQFLSIAPSGFARTWQSAGAYTRRK
jgi:hypothetical protein